MLIGPLRLRLGRNVAFHRFDHVARCLDATSLAQPIKADSLAHKDFSLIQSLRSLP
jgi:hypothetical protein